MTKKKTPDLKGVVKAADSWLIYLSQDLGRVFKRGKNGIDLLVDATGSALNTTTGITRRMARCLRRHHSLSASEEALFRELGSKVAECPGGDYLSLQHDVEFWKLVGRLNSIRRKVGKKAVAREKAEEPKTAKPSTEKREGDPSTEG